MPDFKSTSLGLLGGPFHAAPTAQAPPLRSFRTAARPPAQPSAFAGSASTLIGASAELGRPIAGAVPSLGGQMTRLDACGS